MIPVWMIVLVAMFAVLMSAAVVLSIVDRCVQ